MDAREILRLILAEVREANEKLSDIRSDLVELSSNLSDTPSVTEGSGAEIAAAIKSTGSFTVILLGFILWRLW